MHCLKGETRVVTEGVKGRRSHFYSVSTAADGSEVKTLVTSVAPLLKSSKELQSLM